MLPHHFSHPSISGFFFGVVSAVAAVSVASAATVVESLVMVMLSRETPRPTSAPTAKCHEGTITFFRYSHLSINVRTQWHSLHTICYIVVVKSQFLCYIRIQSKITLNLKCLTNLESRLYLLTRGSFGSIKKVPDVVTCLPRLLLALLLCSPFSGRPAKFLPFWHRFTTV